MGFNSGFKGLNYFLSDIIYIGTVRSEEFSQLDVFIPVKPWQPNLALNREVHIMTTHKSHFPAGRQAYTI